MQVCERSTTINHFPSRLARRGVVFDAMKPLLPPESRNRIRKASVCPVTVVASALTEFGRNDATSAILTSLNKVRQHSHCMPASSTSTRSATSSP